MSATGQAPAAGAGQAPESAATTATTTTTPAATTTTTTETPKTYDESYVKKLRDENAASRVRLKALEDAEAERQKATLSETERLKADLDAANKRSAEADARRREALGTAAVTAAAAKLGIAPALAAKLVTVEFDDAGNPVKVEDALAALVKDHPYLVAGTSSAGATNPARQSGAQHAFDPKNPPRLGTPGLFKV